MRIVGQKSVWSDTTRSSHNWFFFSRIRLKHGVYLFCRWLLLAAVVLLINRRIWLCTFYWFLRLRLCSFSFSYRPFRRNISLFFLLRKCIIKKMSFWILRLFPRLLLQLVLQSVLPQPHQLRKYPTFPRAFVPQLLLRPGIVRIVITIFTTSQKIMILTACSSNCTASVSSIPEVSNVSSCICGSTSSSAWKSFVLLILHYAFYTMQKILILFLQLVLQLAVFQSLPLLTCPEFHQAWAPSPPMPG